MTEVIPISGMKPTSRPRRRLLLVDDNAEGRRALARLLELYGYEVTAVAEGTSALEILRRSPPPDVLLTDLFLPDLDGRDIAREARRIAPSTTIVMITGWDFGADVPSREDAGVDFLFLKPVNVGELVTKLKEFRDEQA
jgi:CheY-like chemotaxis protein